MRPCPRRFHIKDMLLRAYETIAVSRRGRITTIALDRPDVRNSTNATLHGELANIFYDLDSDPETDVVILTGNGSAFCAGGDVGYMQDLVKEQAFYDRIIPKAKRIVGSILDCRKPIIAKLNGHATGFGALWPSFVTLFSGTRSKNLGSARSRGAHSRRRLSGDLAAAD